MAIMAIMAITLIFFISIKKNKKIFLFIFLKMTTTAPTATATNTNNENLMNVVKTSVLITCLIDVVKHLIPMYINFNNHAINFSIITLIITLINYLIYSVDYTKYFYLFSIHHKEFISKNSEAKLKILIDKTDLMSVSWADNSKYWSQLRYFLVDHLAFKINYSFKETENGKIIVPSKGDILSFTSSLFTGTGSVGESYPLYRNSSSLLGIMKKGDIISVCYTDNTIYNDFLDNVLSAYPTNYLNSIEEKPSYNQLQFYSKNITLMQNKRELYKDRNFDGIISIHKEKILSYLNNFIKIQKDGSSIFNGHGSYNLGIMLHGLPGCGKTSLIKAISNHLNRDILVVDMKTIKTCDDFKKLFYGNYMNENEYYKQYIYVFEEFDTIDSVISREITSDNSEGNVLNLNILNDRLIKLISMVNTDNKETVKVEIENVKREITEFREKLNIGTLLTELDGMVEMRGRIIIATTNYIDRIDSALMREGRFDLKIELKPFCDIEIKELLINMYKPNYKDKIMNETFPDRVWTPAKIRNICHLYDSNDIESVISVLKKGPIDLKKSQLTS